MEPFCREVTKTVLPAIRASVAETLSKKHSYTQQEIANGLGIVQVAVSKYVNGRYSNRVKKVKDYIISKNLNMEVVENILNGEKYEEVERSIDRLCTDSSLLALISTG